MKSLLLSIPEAYIKKDAPFGPSLPVNRPLVSLRNRMAKRLCVTNVTGPIARVFCRDLPLTLMIPGVLQKDLLKER